MNQVLVYIFTFFSSISTVFSSSTGSTNTAIELLVNGKNDPPHIVVLEDLKPGDEREVPKDLYAKCTAPAKIYLHLKDVTTDQGIQTEPEFEEENGTPKFDLPKYIYYDLKLGNTVIIGSLDKIPFTDAVSCWIPIGVVPANTHVPLYQSFHFDSTVTNWAQGDKATFTEEFLALDAKDPTVPITDSGRVWDPILKKCIPGPPPTPKVTPTPSPKTSPTPKPTPTPSPKTSPTPHPTPTPSPKSSPTPRPTPTPSPKSSPTPSVNPSPKTSPSPSPSTSPRPWPFPWPFPWPKDWFDF